MQDVGAGKLDCVGRSIDGSKPDIAMMQVSTQHEVMSARKSSIWNVCGCVVNVQSKMAGLCTSKERKEAAEAGSNTVFGRLGAPACFVAFARQT